MKKYIVGAILSIGLLVTPVFTQAALTSAQIQAVLDLLSAFGADSATIANVNVALTGGTQTPPSCPTLTSNLYLGLDDSDTDGEVTKLQRFLASNSAIYPEGLITGYFGPLTELAVKRWQAANGIVSSGTPDTTGYGVVGPNTRAAIGRACGTTPLTTNINFSASPTSGFVPLLVGFSALSEPNMSASRYYIDFGDGSSQVDMQGVSGICQVGAGGPCNGGNNMLASHTYLTAGTYTATLIRRYVCNATAGQPCITPDTPVASANIVVTQAQTATTTISINVVYPNGGEQITIGGDSSFTTLWDSNFSGGDVRVYLRRSSSIENIGCLLGTVPVSQGYFSINLGSSYQCPNVSMTITAGEYKIYVEPDHEAGISDLSNGFFTLTASTTTTTPTITAIYPAGGETINVNATTTLRGNWTNMQSLSFALYKNGIFSKWIVSNIVPGCSTTCAGGGLYNWRPSNTILASEAGTQHTFKILFQGYDNTGGVHTTFSNEFKIDNPASVPTITAIYPSGGETLNVSATTTLRGNWTNMQSLSFALYKNDSFKKWIVENIVPQCSTTCPGGGLYNWMPSSTIPASEVGSQHNFKILFQGYDNNGGVYTTFSNNFKLISDVVSVVTPPQSSIMVVYPNGGEQTSIKDADFTTIWKSSISSGAAYVYLTFADGRNCFLGTAPFSQGYFTATLDGAGDPGYQCFGTTETITNGQYKVLIDTDANQNNNVSGGYDSSDNYFTITDSVTTTSTITAIYPAGNETFGVNSTVELKGSWTNMKSISFTLHKNGIFYKWIKQNFVPGCGTSCVEGKYNWVPSSTIPASETGAQHSFKVFFQGIGFNGQTYSTSTNEFKII